MTARIIASATGVLLATVLIAPVISDAGGVRGGFSVRHGHGHGHGFKHGFKGHRFNRHGVKPRHFGAHRGGHSKRHRAFIFAPRPFGHFTVHPGARPSVWIPGGWYWTGWSWVWVRGHWR